MAAISPGNISFRKVFQYDLFDITFDIEGVDITGKTLLMQVRENPDAAVSLEFMESDGSLTKTVVSTTKTTVRLYKDSHDMTVEPLFQKGESSISYYLTIIMFTQDADIEDIITIAEGTMEVVDQITLVP
jgi:hypothetical protein